MGFEIVERGLWKAAEALKPGQVSIGSNGHLTFLAEDLALVGVSDLATVLCDTGTLRIALRPPRDGEGEKAMTVQVVKNHKGLDGGRRAVNCSRAFKRLALDVRVCVGRLNATTHDDLVIVNLTDIELGPADKKESTRRK